MRRWHNLKQLWLPFTSSEASVYASSACFYILLSLLPAAMLLSALIPALHISPTILEPALEQLIPPQFFPIIGDILAESDHTIFASASAIVLLWSASKGILAITDGLCTLTDTHRPRRFLRRRLGAMLSFLVLCALLILVLVLYVFSKQLLRLLGFDAQPLHRIRYLYVPLALSVLFAGVYRLLPGKRFSLPLCFLGGSISAAGWIGFSALFSIYVNFATGFRVRYGNPGLLLLACIWLQWCIALFLYGGLLIALIAGENYHPIQIIKKAFKK